MLLIRFDPEERSDSETICLRNEGAAKEKQPFGKCDSVP
jgi:hypothetical protein